MAQFYEMPAVSPTMETGTLVKWKVAEGTAFDSGTVLAEIGTDKANMDAEIFDAGVLLKHLLAEGDDAPAGYPIAIWGKKADEDIAPLVAEFAKREAARVGGTPAPQPAAAGAPAAPAPEPAAPEATPAVSAAATPAAATPAAATSTAATSAAATSAAATSAAATSAAATPAAATPAPATSAPAPAAPASAGATAVLREWSGRSIHVDHYDPPGDLRYGVTPARIAASPLARAMAADLGVELKGVKGSGPGGRIVAADVESAKAKPAAAVPGTSGRPDEVIRNTTMRKTIARRLLESHEQIPTFFLTVTLDMAGFVAFRETLKARLPETKISYNDMLIAAVARSLRENPAVNASWAPDAITRHGRVDIGVAVALPQGLITPVVRNADRKSLSEIAADVRALAGRAKDQKLTPEEYTGGTFTISNLGMLDIDHFTAIVNPPEAAILAVGAIQQVPIVGPDGALTVGHRMVVTMTCDHRVIDGAVGAVFLQSLRKYVESPVLLLV